MAENCHLSKLNSIVAIHKYDSSKDNKITFSFNRKE